MVVVVVVVLAAFGRETEKYSVAIGGETIAGKRRASCHLPS